MTEVGRARLAARLCAHSEHTATAQGCLPAREFRFHCRTWLLVNDGPGEGVHAPPGAGTSRHIDDSVEQDARPCCSIIACGISASLARSRRNSVVAPAVHRSFAHQHYGISPDIVNKMRQPLASTTPARSIASPWSEMHGTTFAYATHEPQLEGMHSLVRETTFLPGWKAFSVEHACVEQLQKV